MVEVDYPAYWDDLIEQIVNKLNASKTSSELIACLTALQKVIKKYERSIDQERTFFEAILSSVLPYMEFLLLSQMKKWEDGSREIIVSSLQIMYSSVVMSIPLHINSEQSLYKWMFAIKLLLDKPVPKELTAQPKNWSDVIAMEEHSEWIIKALCFKIINKLVIHCCGEDEMKDFKDFIEQFVLRYALGFFECSTKMLVSAQSEFVAPKVASLAIQTLVSLLELDNVYELAKVHLERILLDYLMPLLMLNMKDDEYWRTDPQEFIYSERIKSNDHSRVKNSAENAILIISKLRGPQGEVLVYKMFNFICCCFSNRRNVRTGKDFDLLSFEYMLHALQIISEVIRVEKPILDKLPDVMANVVIPAMSHEENLIKARACSTFEALGSFAVFNNISVYENLSRTVCQNLMSKCLPVQVAAAESLPVLLAHPQAKQLLKTDLKNILVYVLELMNAIDLDDLVDSLQGIVVEFEECMDQYAIPLVKGLTESFFKYKDHSGREEEAAADELPGESNRAAEACLNTMSNLLKRNLNAATYAEIREPILSILHFTLLQNDDLCFERCLGLFNLMLYKSDKVTADLGFYYPLLCYLILGRPNSKLTIQLDTLPEPQQELLEKVDLKREWLEDLSMVIGCFLNFMQKIGPDFLEASDYFGNKFVHLIFEIIKKIGNDSLARGTFENLSCLLRLITGLLENFPNRCDHMLPMILNIVRGLFAQSKGLGVEKLKSMVLQVVAVMLWYDSQKTFILLKQEGCLMDVLQNWFGGLKVFTSECEKERELIGLGAMLSLPRGWLPEELQLNRIMGEVVSSIEALTEFRRASNRQPEAIVDERVTNDPKNSQTDDVMEEDEEDTDSDEVTFNVISSPISKILPSTCCTTRHWTRNAQFSSSRRSSSRSRRRTCSTSSTSSTACRRIK